MKRFFSAVFLSFAALVSAQEKPAYAVKADDVSAFLETLSSDAMEGRQSGTAGIEKAAVFLEQFFQKNGIKPYFKTYRDSVDGLTPATFNIVGYLEGTDPELKKEFVILSAHYDHLGKMESGEDTVNNGANDDASGVTAVAELAKYLSRTRANKRSILFVFFSGEERGLLGSKSLAAKLKKQSFNLYTMLNFEMIGVPMKENFTAYLTGYNKSNMGEKLNKYVPKKRMLGYWPKEQDYELFRRSDNISFYKAFGAPCHTVSTFTFDNFEFYHFPGDEVAKLNVPFMAGFIQDMLAPVTSLTQTAEKDITLYNK